MAEGSLRRLGGGRWQSRDERFTIEPQSGTWVVVDGEQVDDLGLPLVRGPFRSLGEARAAIEEARRTAPTESPLSARVEESRREAAERPARTRRESAGRGDTGHGGAASSGPPRTPGPSPTRAGAAVPEPPREPAWLAKLDVAGKRRARRLLRALQRAGVEDAESIVRAEIVGGQPALARVAIDRRVRETVAASGDGPGLAQAVVDILMGGRDHQLGTSWRLVDGEDRPIRSLRVTG